MATVLVAWELGGGLGHLTRLLPVVRGLAQRGHRVVAAVQDVVRASRVFGDVQLTLIQAPARLNPPIERVDPPRSFPHILHNCGFGREDTLRARASAWRDVVDLTRPELIVFDHSPTALLAARCCSARRMVLGNGFCCPAAETPFRDLRPWLPSDPAGLARDEDRVLENANSVLLALGGKPMRRLSALYADAEETCLATFRELDAFPDRALGEYWGTWSESRGGAADWPRGNGKRVFAYLSPFPALPALLGKLRATGCPTLAYVRNVAPALARRLSSASMRLATGRLDLAHVGTSCDIAILNGGHGTTAAMLLAGKPTLQIPHYLEQAMTANAVVRMGAGLAAERGAPEQVECALDSLLGTDYFSAGARRFAANHSAHRPAEVIERLLDRCEELIGPKQSGPPRRGPGVRTPQSEAFSVDAGTRRVPRRARTLERGTSSGAVRI